MSRLGASELFNVKGMVFVVTGGGSGIGAMMAEALDANGASKVFILGRRLEKLQEVATSASNKSVIPVQCDISSQSEIERVAGFVTSHTPFVNALISNHGIKGPTLDDLPKERALSLNEMQAFLWKSSMDEFNDAFLVDTTAPFYVFVAFMHLLDAGNRHEASPTVSLGVNSQFIVTGSISGFQRIPKMGYAYSGSKLAITHIAKQLATMMVPYQIRTNVIAPGVYPSDMSTRFMSGVGDIVPESIVPLQRMGNEEDVAGVTLFLCSRAGAYIDGTIITTDGGRLGIVPATY